MGKVLEITTKIGCSINCHYCPQSLLLQKYFNSDSSAVSMMSLDTFKKCIDKVPKEVMIDFAGMSEPWLNPQCTEMVQYAAAKGHKISVFSTLAGMTESDLAALESLDIEQFVIHIPDAEEHARIPVTEEYKRLLQRAAHLNIHANRHFSCHGTVHPAIAEYVDHKAIIADEMVDRAGNLDCSDIEHQQVEGRCACLLDGEQLNHNVLMPDGRVLLCCMDYGMQHVLGNLLKENYESIINGSVIRQLRNAMRSGDSRMLCANCSNALSFSELAVQYTVQRDKALELWDGNRWLNQELALQKEYIADLLKAKAWHEQQIQNLQQALSETQRGAEALNSGKAWLEVQVQNLQAALSETQQGANALVSDKAWIEEQLQQAKKLTDTQEQEIDTLKNELAKTNYKIKRLKENKWICRIIEWKKLDI